MRRSAQFQIELGDNNVLQQAAVDSAIEEMVFMGGALNLTLLGGSRPSLMRQTCSRGSLRDHDATCIGYPVNRRRSPIQLSHLSSPRRYSATGYITLFPSDYSDNLLVATPLSPIRVV